MKELIIIATGVMVYVNFALFIWLITKGYTKKVVEVKQVNEWEVMWLIERNAQEIFANPETIKAIIKAINEYQLNITEKIADKEDKEQGEK